MQQYRITAAIILIHFKPIFIKNYSIKIVTRKRYSRTHALEIKLLKKLDLVVGVENFVVHVHFKNADNAGDL